MLLVVRFVDVEHHVGFDVTLCENRFQPDSVARIVVFVQHGVLVRSVIVEQNVPDFQFVCSERFHCFVPSVLFST